MGENSIDFGYPWWLSYGHLVFLLLVLALLWAGRRWRWGRWTMALLGLVAVWAGLSAGIMRFVMNADGRAALPTQEFLREGVGRVLDIGAGTGRSTVMVLEARPQASVVALDLFADSFAMHFGESVEPREMLRRNLRAASVAGRAEIETGDMRSLPFAAGSFDAAVSCFALDHLGVEGGREALAEAARVVRPGGDFLLMVGGNDGWGMFTFGPVMMHTARGAGWWRTEMEAAGFAVAQDCRQPFTTCLLGRRR